MSPRVMTPTCCCAGAIRSLPTRPSSIPTNQTAEAQAKQFGYNNDFVGFIPIDGAADHGLLVVNHEYTNAHLMFPGIVTIEKKARSSSRAARPRSSVDVEMAAHGGTHRRDPQGRTANGRSLSDGKMNRRITATTEMMLTGPAAGMRG